MKMNFRKHTKTPSVQAVPQVALPRRRITTLEALRVDLNDMEDYCLNRKTRSLSRNTIRNWQANVRAVFSRMGYIEYSRDYIREVRHRLEEDDIQVSTLNLYLMSLQEFFRANFDEGFTIARPKTTWDTASDKDKYHTPEEVRVLIGHVDTSTIYGVRDKALLSLLYFAALRNSELVHLTVNDYDAESKCVIVRAHGQWHPKSYQARKMYVPDVCNNAVVTWLETREREGIGVEPDSPLFLSATGGQLGENALRQLIRRRSEEVGLRTYPHKLRHSRCSHLGNGINGSKPWPVAILSKFMGHSNIAVTSRYIHSNDENQIYCLSNTQEIEF